MNNKKFISIFVMLCTIIIGMLCCGKEVQAASSGTIPCSSGSVSWTLDDEGVLTFSGNGTTKLGKYVECGDGSRCWVEDWNVYWSEVAGVDVTAVTSVMVTENSVIQLDTCKNMFRDFSSVTSVNLVGINTGKVTNMWGVFQNCSSLKELDVSSFNTENVTDMHAMFYNCSSLTELEISNFNTEKVIDMLAMFNGCSSLEELDVSNFKTENVTSMNGMFYGCSSLEELDVSNFKTENVTSMSSMFDGCSSLEELNLTNFNTENVTNMGWMFSGCSSLEELELSNFNTENITDMGYMFDGCSSLEKLELSNFKTENVTDMWAMFNGCYSLVELELSNFNTENVTNMGWMFSGCRSLEKLDLSTFRTGNVTYMGYMFNGCSLLKELDVSSFNTENVTEMGNMFSSCRSLKELDVSSFNTEKVNHMGCMFLACNSLKELDLSKFDVRRVSSMIGLVGGCDALIRFVTPKTFSVLELPRLSTGKVWKDTADNSYKDTQYYTFERSTELNLVDEIYTISYVNTDKATDTEGLIEEYTYGSEYTLPELKGQCVIFKGWFLDKEYTKECSSITDTTTGNLTFYAKWEDAHDIVRKNEVAATCHSTGYSGDEYCQACEKQFTVGHVLETVAHDYDMENGTVLTEATTTTTGTIQYKCKNCTATITGTIPRLQGVEESTILDKKSEDDIKGSSFSLLQARADKVTRNSIRLKWTRVEHADGYIIYGNKCGRKYSYKKIKTIDKNNTTTYTHKKLNGKNLKKGTYYKYIVIAYKNIEGQKISIAVSKTVHAATNGGKYGSAKSITIKTDNKLKKKNKQYILTLKKNKKYTINASEVNQSKKIKRHRKIAYESTDAKVVTVSKKGVIKGKNKGICYVYVYAQNGVYKKIKVTVN